MEIHKRKLNKVPQLRIQQELNRPNKLSNTALSLSRIQNNMNQNSEAVNVDQSILNDFEMLLNPNQLSNQNYPQSKLIMQKEAFYKKYENALVCIQIKNQQSLRRAFGILNSLAFKLQKQPQFLELIQYNILENVVFNLWKTSRQIAVDNLNTKTTNNLKCYRPNNLIQYLSILQTVVKQRKIKDTKLGTLCLVIAKQLYENNEFVQSLQIADKGFKYCPRNRNISLLLKIHYLKSKIYNKIQAFQLQGQEIKKCIFFMNNLNQNVQKKQFGEQFLRMLIYRKEQLKKINKQKSVLFKDTSKINNNHSIQAQPKFRTKSISFSRLKNLNLNIQQNKMQKTVKNSKHKNFNYSKMQCETKKVFLKLDINHKSKLKKKTQTIWQRQTDDAIGRERQNQKIRQQLEKVTYNQFELIQKTNFDDQNFPFHLLLKRPTDKKCCLKVIEKKQSKHNIQQQVQLEIETSAAQLQLTVNNQNIQLVNQIKPQSNLKGLIRILQVESLEKFILKSTIGFNKLEQWGEDSQQILGQNQEISQNQNANKEKNSKIDYQSEQQLKQQQIQSLCFPQLALQQVIFQKGIVQILKLQVKLEEKPLQNISLSYLQDRLNCKHLIISSKIKLNYNYYKISLKFQLKGYSEKQVKLILKSKQELYKWIMTEKKQSQTFQKEQYQMKQEQSLNNQLNFISSEQLDKNLKELIIQQIQKNIEYEQKLNGKILKQTAKKQKQFFENSINNQNKLRFEQLVYQLRQKQFQFYYQNALNFKYQKNNQLSWQNTPKCFFIVLLKDQMNMYQSFAKNKFNDFALIEKQIIKTKTNACSVQNLRQNNFPFRANCFIKKTIRTNQINKSSSTKQSNKQIQSYCQNNSIQFQVIQGLQSIKQQYQGRLTNLNKEGSYFKEKLISLNRKEQGFKIQLNCSLNIQDLLDCLLKKTLIQSQCQKSQIVNTYYQYISTSSIFRLSSQKCAFVNVKCFRMKNIYRKQQKDQRLYYLFELQEQQTRTRMTKFIIKQLQLKHLFSLNNINCHQLYTKDSLCQILKNTCTYFVIKKNYIYSKIGLETKNNIFYLINKFRIMKPLYTSIQNSNQVYASNDLIKQILMKNTAIPNSQFINQQIKAKKIVCQKCIIIRSSRTSNSCINQQDKDTKFFGVLSVIKIQKSNHFTIKIYLPLVQRSFSLNLTKIIIEYLSQDTLQFIFKNIQDIAGRKRQNILEIMFQSQKQIQTKIWSQLIQIIQVQQKSTQNKNYMIVKIDKYHAFLKDSSCFDYFQVNNNIYQIQMTLQKTKKQDIHSPNNIQQDVNVPLKIQNRLSKRNNYKYSSKITETTKDNKFQREKKLLQKQNSCYSKLQSIYQSETIYFILYIRISQVFSNTKQQSSNDEQINGKEQQYKISKRSKKNKKQRKTNCKKQKDQQLQSFNISFYLSQLLFFLRQQNQNFSQQFTQNYYTQAQLQNSFELIKLKIIQQFRQFTNSQHFLQKSSFLRLKQKILKKLNLNLKIQTLVSQNNQQMKIAKNKIISLNFSRTQTFQEGPKYLNLSLLSNQKRKILSIFHCQKQLLYLITNLKTFQIKKMVISTQIGSFPYLQILAKKNQLNHIHQRLFKYFKNKLQLC